LIVDDSPTEVHVLKTARSRSTASIPCPRPTAPQCLSLAREVRPDLIFMDVVMPRVNGYQARAR